MMDDGKQYAGNLSSRVARMESLVDYQNGAVVSREIVNKQTGTVTLFAFEEGQGLSEHTAPFDALIHILDGNARVTISGQAYHLEKGEMIIMPANQPHAVQAQGRFKMTLVMIRS
jgi:quercetin dioxygenase-like cupin family protein